MKAGCDGHKWAAAHTAHAVLLWLSVSILALFFLELSALVVCLRRAFLRNKLYLLDLIIVSPISPPLSPLYLPYISPVRPHHRHQLATEP